METVCEVEDIRTNAITRFPAVLANGNAADNDFTVEPSAALDCTSAMPEAIVMLNARVAVCELASITCTVKLLVPVVIGVPEITPVPAARVSPAGRDPAVIDQM